MRLFHSFLTENLIHTEHVQFALVNVITDSTLILFTVKWKITGGCFTGFGTVLCTVYYCFCPE